MSENFFKAIAGTCSYCGRDMGTSEKFHYLMVNGKIKKILCGQCFFKAFDKTLGVHSSAPTVRIDEK